MGQICSPQLRLIITALNSVQQVLELARVVARAPIPILYNKVTDEPFFFNLMNREFCQSGEHQVLFMLRWS